MDPTETPSPASDDGIRPLESSLTPEEFDRILHDSVFAAGGRPDQYVIHLPRAWGKSHVLRVNSTRWRDASSP